MIFECIDVAMGRNNADLIIENGLVFDVFNHRFVETDVVISNSRVVALGSGYSANRTIDATGRYVVPSFIDSHAHIESSLLIPSEYARIVIPKGVTTVIADPHEIANVLGETGISYMFKSAESVPLDIEYMLPSCVPCTPFEHSGSIIDSKLTKDLLSKYKFLGLAEMMNYIGVINGESEVMDKLSNGVFVDGHAPMLSGRELCAYICAGIKTDHECSSISEALEKISLGMSILVREGTGAKNISDLVGAITPYNLHRFAFCTDDKHIGDIVKEGTILNCIKKAIEYGLSLEDALTMATINPAKIYNLSDKGAIAPNYRADILICDRSLDTIYTVLKDGDIVSQDGIPTFSVSHHVQISHVTNTVHIKPVVPADFDKAYVPHTPVIEVSEGSLITKACYPETVDGLSRCAVVERHKATGYIGTAYIKNLRIHGGAIAQTIGHDSHNITVLGDNPSDMALAVNSLGNNGGISVVYHGKVVSYLELDVAGLMSSRPYEEVLSGDSDIMEKVKLIAGGSSSTVLMLLSFLSLLVIPEIKLNDSGLYYVSDNKITQIK